jgi:DNA-binding beta-propeller fold protein YncE
MYSFPGLTLEGRVQVGDPEGLCVDERTGSVWVVSTVFSKIVEFAHGGTTSIATLTDGEEYPDACAVDPITGDLAVANLNDGGSDQGSVAIYKKSHGSAHLFSDRNIYFVSFLAYDDKGNLFVDGSGQTLPSFRLAELPYGAKRFKDLSLTGARVKAPAGVAYHRGTLAIGDRKRSVIFQTANGRVLGRTPLGKACYISQFLIVNSQAMVANTCGSIQNPTGQLLIYDYPRGGAPVNELKGFGVAFGVALSR